MNAKEEITNAKRIETIDSSELSSNISDEQSDTSMEKITIFSPIESNHKALTGKCKSSKKLKEKRTRFLVIMLKTIFLIEMLNKY